MTHGRELLIHAYSREQAIADGVLVDISKTAREAGFVFPVAVTCGVWAECVCGQDEAGRLRDLLVTLRLAIRQAGDGHRVDFSVRVRSDDSPELPSVRLYAVCGPGDDGEPVVTIMLPHED
ncbi:MAG: hypothetical protein KatS3mg108_2612 [Isosphaeraceae bacterium]|jgi:hypothetical protein|nr:MAG: hypothetical protein KatS3mg108_2612 [Isosphaeraceae bacterium]